MAMRMAGPIRAVVISFASLSPSRTLASQRASTISDNALSTTSSTLISGQAGRILSSIGAEVTLFSRSSGKEEDAQRLGADHIVISTDITHMAAVVGRFDLIIDTVPYDHDVNPYVATLAPDCAQVLVGYPDPL